jgi:hypothetical protein
MRAKLCNKIHRGDAAVNQLFPCSRSAPALVFIWAKLISTCTKRALDYLALRKKLWALLEREKRSFEHKTSRRRKWQPFSISFDDKRVLLSSFSMVNLMVLNMSPYFFSLRSLFSSKRAFRRKATCVSVENLRTEICEDINK